MEKEGSYDVGHIPREMKKDACVTHPVVLIIQKPKDETVFSILGSTLKLNFI